MTDLNIQLPPKRQIPTGQQPVSLRHIRAATLSDAGFVRVAARAVPAGEHMSSQTSQKQAGPAYARPSLDQVGAYRAIGKRIIDVAFVLVTFPLALLLIGIPALMLWREGGSPFYRQIRLGQNGNQFSILKLRTMVRDADQILERTLASDPALRREWDTTQKLKNDPRITRVGAFLRKTSLDELPQLWNVLIGDMSLVGPRPMLPEQLPLYGDANHYFALRPGITGLWQVSNRNESHFQLRMTLDAEYDYDLSFSEDIRIMWRTVGAVVGRTGY